MGVFRIFVALIRGIVAHRAYVAAEDFALRQQLAVLERQSKRPPLRKRDRIFWVRTFRQDFGSERSPAFLCLPESRVRASITARMAGKRCNLRGAGRYKDGESFARIHNGRGSGMGENVIDVSACSALR